MSGLYADISGPGSVVAAQMAVEDFKAAEQGHQGRDHLGRPPEQAGRRLDHRPQVVRPGQGRRDPRRADLLGRARGQRGHAREEQDLHDLGRRHVRPHRREVLAEQRPLDLRHLGARQRHRHGDDQDGRRHLVLPDRRLRLRRTRSSATRRRPSKKAGGKVRRRASSTRSRAPTSRPSCSRRRPRRPRSSASPMPARDTINSIKQAAEFGITQGGPERSPACWSSRPT